MAYTRHNWVTGEVITADKLNNIEDALSSRVSLVKLMEINVTFSDGVELWGSGGGFTDGKTFGELIGDKRFVGVEVQSTPPSSSGDSSRFYQCSLNVAGKNPSISQDDSDVRNATGATVYIHRMNAKDAYTCTMEIYAVCI